MTHTPSDLAADLDGRAFSATGATGMDLLDGVPVTLEFTGDRLAAHAGCNRIFGPITWEGDVLQSEGFAATMMACPEPVDAQERAVLQLLGNRPTALLDGESLTLRGTTDTGEVTLEFTERRAPTLEGTRWVLTGIVKDEGVHSLPAGAAASLELTDGEAAVEFGCNTGGGAVTITEGTIEFGFLRMTRKLCPPEVMEVENHVFSVLQGAVAYELLGEELRLSTGGIGLRLRAG